MHALALVFLALPVLVGLASADRDANGAVAIGARLHGALGCPDTDADGVCDDLDNCPGTPNPKQGFPNPDPPEKLSGPLAPGGDVSWPTPSFLISPDSTRIVYVADQDADEVFELYSVSMAGGTPVKLNGPLVVGGNVSFFLISPDSATVVYRADQDVNDVDELYGVPIEGGSPVKLNGPLVSGGDVFSTFLISPDGATVVYVADQDLDEVHELFSVPIDGGKPVKLNGPLVPGGEVFYSYQHHDSDPFFFISPDAARVVYRADQDVNQVFELYSVPIGGGTPVKLNGPLSDYEYVYEPLISPDGASVVYGAYENENQNESYDLYSVPIEGGTPVKLNEALGYGGGAGSALISPDSATVVYRKTQNFLAFPELYSVPIGGGIPIKLNGPLVDFGEVSSSFSISPDAARVVYRADQEIDAVVELFSVPIGGGAPLKLSGPLITGGDVTSFLIDLDGTRVVYRADQDVDEVFELYGVPISGGTPIQLNGPVISGGDVFPFQIAPDGTAVVYGADQDVNDVSEIYSVSITGGTPVKLSGPLVAGGDAFSFRISPDGAAIVYRADQEVDERFELYRADTVLDVAGADLDHDGHGAACDCDDANPHCTADCTDLDSDDFCVGSDCDEANPLCGPDCTDADADGYCVTTDCDEASPSCNASCADADADGVRSCNGDCNDTNPHCTADCTDLDADGFCVGADCDEANPHCGSDCTDPDADGYCVTSDCDEADPSCNASCADADADGVRPCDGDCNDANPHCVADCTDTDADGLCDDVDNCAATANPKQGFPNQEPPERLSQPPGLFGGGTLFTFLVSPDSARVVYRWLEGPINDLELFSVPLDGGAPVKLTSASRILVPLAISPDSTTVIYLSDEDSFIPPPLYSVPIEGGTPVMLNQPLAAGGEVLGPVVSSDSATVVYRADQVNEVFELFSVPIGGGIPVKLNGPLATGGDVVSFLVSPDGDKVVYRAYQDVNDAAELYSVPIGGGIPVKLNDPLVPGGDVSTSFLISPDGTTVVYEAGGLYSVPIGGGTPVKLNGPLVPGGDVGSFLISPDGATVVYRADQDVDDVVELYSVPIGGGDPVKLNGPLVPGADVSTSFLISPDGTTVVYEAGGLYSVPIGGGTPILLTSIGDLSQISPDSARVVYRTYLDGAQLFSVPIGGGSPVQINDPLVDGGNVDPFSFEISSDGAAIVYLADQEQGEKEEALELFNVSITGGTPVKLNGPLAVFYGSVTSFVASPDGTAVVYRANQEEGFDYGIYRAYTVLDAAGADLDHDGHGAPCDCDDAKPHCMTTCTDLDDDGFCAETDCDEANPNCTADCSDADGDGFCVGWDCDDTWPGCTTDCTDADGDGLALCAGDCNDVNPHCSLDCTDADGDGYCVGSDCHEANAACTTDCTDADGDGYCVTADCDEASPSCNASCTDADGDGVRLCDGDCNDANPSCTTDCTDTDADGVCEAVDNCPATANPKQGFPNQAAPLKLNGPLVPGSGVTTMVVSPDSARVVYLADQVSNEDFELFSTLLDGGLPAKLNGPLVSGGDVMEPFRISPDGATVVYLADQDTNDVVELYSVPIGGGAIPVKLNGPLVSGGDVGNVFLISPDSTTVVYLADQDTNDVVEIYSVPIEGGTPVKLNGPLVSGGDVSTSFLISPDSATVVYLADQDTNDVVELYSVPIEGGIPVKLNGPLVSGGDVSTSFLISPDGATVVYLADRDTNDVVELYSVPIEGGTPVKLNGPLVSGGDVSTPFLISADSSTVVYQADQGVNELFELYSVPIGGGTPVKLNGPLVPGGDVYFFSPSFLISADSSTVVYLADQDVNEVFELYSVPIGGGTTVKLNGPLVPGGAVYFFSLSFLISPDGSTVVYRADQEANEVFELYSVPIGGGMPVKLNGALVAGGDAVASLISPDGSAVVYGADQEVDEQFELFSVPITGGTPVVLNGALAAGGDAFAPLISPDGAAVVYRADQELDQRFEIYRVSTVLDAAGADLDHDGLGGACDCDDGNARCTTDCTDADADGFCTLADCDDNKPLCTTTCTDLDLDGYCADTDCDDARLACTTDCTDADSDGLPLCDGDCNDAQASCTTDCTDADGDGLPQCEGDCNDANPHCSTVCTDSDSDGYCVDTDCDDARPACTTSCADSDGDGLARCDGDCNDANPGCTTDCTDTDADGVCDVADNCPATPNPNQGFANQEPPEKLNGLLVSGGDVVFFLISPDGARVAYLADQDADSVDELYSVAIGGGTPVKLNGPAGSNGDVFSPFLISPDGATVVYLADQGASNVVNLYSVPILGGTPVKLNGPLVSGGNVFTHFLISADGATVVYLADQDVDGIVELYSVPLGGGIPVKLNGPLVQGGDVVSSSPSFLISPDGTTVVYLADQDVDNVVELYGVPIGGGTPVKLNGPLVSGGDVISFPFLISADSEAVVYLADQDTDEVVELYGVPIEGGTPVKLNGPLVSGGDVTTSFRISSDGDRVVYVADQDIDEEVELYSVPIGGGTSIQLNGPLVSGGDVSTSFLISPDSSAVVYQADQGVDEVFELYSVPIEGGTPVKLNGPLVPGGDVYFISPSFLISPDSATVVYQAEQDVDNTVELYSVPIGDGTPIQLNGLLADGGDVYSFAISPDGSMVLYLANQEHSAVFELFSVPITGGTPVKLNGPLVAGGGVTSYRTSADAAAVVFAADQEVNERYEIYRAYTTLDAAGADLDHDGLGGACDCNDAKPHCTTICADLDADGFCADTDCDEARASCSTDCTDADEDGLPLCAGDCDDDHPSCSTDCTDADADGLPPCAGDCDDAHPGCTTDCTDSDGDELPSCAEDCDDDNPHCTTDCTDADADGFCVTTDCDEATESCNASCADADGDDLRLCAGDCDDDNPHCGTDCTDADADGYCVTSDCDEASPSCNASCADADGDGVRACDGDCNDTFPGARPEVCTDGLDNDCNGDTDAADAACSFLVATSLRATGPLSLEWDPAPGADAHALYRGTIPASGFSGYDHVCEGTLLEAGTAEDPDLPPPGKGYYYFVAGQEVGQDLRVGPLGAASNGGSRPDSDAVTCGPRVYVDPDNLVGAQDGLSWATAYTGLGGAFDHAAYPGRGLEVWLRDSVAPDDGAIGDVSAALRPGVRVLGGFTGTEAASWERPAGTRTAVPPVVAVGTSLGLERVRLGPETTTGVLLQPAGVWLEVVETESAGLSGYAVDVTGPLGRAHVEDNTWDASAGQGGLRIRLRSGKLTGRVAHNTVLGGSGAGLHLEAKPTSGDATVALQVVANTVVAGGVGIRLRADSTAVPHAATEASFVGSNLVYGTSGSSIAVEAHGSFAAAGVGTVSARPLIVGNTLSDGGAAGLSCTATRTGVSTGNAVRCESQVWDNLISFHTGAGIAESVDNEAGAILSDPRVVGNDLYGNGALYLDEGVSELPDILAVNTLFGAYDNYDADPGYVDRGAGDYHLVYGTVLGLGSAMRYLANASDPGLGLSWVAESFDDQSWPAGSYGVGYDLDLPPNALPLLRTQVAPKVSSVFTRTRFTVTDVSDVSSLTFGVDYDDGVVAWINGVEVFRSASMPPEPPDWNSAVGEHESGNAAAPAYELHDVSAAGLPALVEGENVLAVGVWNARAGSSDLVLVPLLVLNDEPEAIDAGHFEAPRRSREDLDGGARVIDGDRDGTARPDTGADER